MRRIALVSLIGGVLLAAAAGARSVIRDTHCFGGSTASATSGDVAGCEPHDAALAGTRAKATGNKDAFMAMVCGNTCATGVEHREADLVAQPGAGEEDLTRCPVSGVVFAVGERNPAVAYRGDTYRLCCAGCEKAFRKDPARFVAS